MQRLQHVCHALLPASRATGRGGPATARGSGQSSSSATVVDLRVQAPPAEEYQPPGMKYDIVLSHHPLRQHGDGGVLHEDLEALQALEAAAAETKDYRRAAVLYQTYAALRPKPSLGIAECAPTGTDAQVAFFLEHGFCILHNVLPTAQHLDRARVAWDRVQQQVETTAAAQETLAAEGFFDLPNLLSEDDVFLDILDSPAVVPLMSRVCGAPHALEPDSEVASAGYTGCMRSGGMGGRVVPPNEHGYTRWHQDHPQPDDAANPSYRDVKIMLGLWDIPVNGGCTAVVPGTHRLPAGPQQTFARGAFRYDFNPNGLEQRLMANFVEAALPANSAIAFVSVLHACTALPPSWLEAD